MKILVANVGSTSFKFRLYRMDGQELDLASGLAERIGLDGGEFSMQLADRRIIDQRNFADHAEAITFGIGSLVNAGLLQSPGDLDAVGFKAVLAGDCDPVNLVDDQFLDLMESYSPVAPVHNPLYVGAMRMFAKIVPGVPLVAAMEMGFHIDMPERRRTYAVPPEWAGRYGLRRYGYHGASHRYVATALAELQPDARRIISCHLGGSSSVSAVLDGKSMGNSMGLSPQSGLPHTNRMGEIDAFAFPLLMHRAGLSAEQILDVLGGKSGMAGLSDTSGDMREVQAAAEAGSKKARLAVDIYITALRDYIGAYLVELGGADALVFTAGIGQRAPQIRQAACRGLDFAGIVLDEQKNASAKPDMRIDAPESAAAIWVLQTNEELIVARQTRDLLAKELGQDKGPATSA